MTLLELGPCSVCGTFSVFEVPTPAYELWLKGSPLQNVWPDASAEMRAFVESGGDHKACLEPPKGKKDLAPA